MENINHRNWTEVQSFAQQHIHKESFSESVATLQGGPAGGRGVGRPIQSARCAGTPTAEEPSGSVCTCGHPSPHMSMPLTNTYCVGSPSIHPGMPFCPHTYGHTRPPSPTTYTPRGAPHRHPQHMVPQMCTPSPMSPYPPQDVHAHTHPDMPPHSP